MNTVAENNVLPPEGYVVEIDGKIRSVYGIFIEALKAGMELKQKFPHSHIKVHNVTETWNLTDLEIIGAQRRTDIGNAATDRTPEMMFDRPVEAAEFALGRFGNGRKT